MEATRPKSHTGDYNIKRRFGKGFRSSKKSMMIFGNKKEEPAPNDSFEKYLNSTPHRSCSLNALYTGQVLLQPRMAQLETLEAKMARIENSLSNTPRKKKLSTSNGSITTTLINASNPSNLNSPNCIEEIPVHNQFSPESKSNSLKSLSTYSKNCQNGANTIIYKTSKDISREMEALKNALRDKEVVIHNLKGQLNTSLNLNRLSTTYLQSKQKGDHTLRDKQAAEERLERLKHETENKTMLIKNIKLELERLDITDNIDVRIQQAELEYQLGREELNLLSILEEIQSLKAGLEECEAATQQNEHATLFNFVQNKPSISLHSTEIIYDPKSPRFGANVSDDGEGMYVEWSTEDSCLLKGDRLLEINGKITFGLKSHDDMIRLLSVSPNPAQIVVLRQHHPKERLIVSTLQEELDAYREKAGEAERIRDSFRSDNVRLTHRISYLEEQVAELLGKASKDTTVPNLLAQSVEYVPKERKPKPQIQIFQKGPKVTLIGNVESEKNDMPVINTKVRTGNRSTILVKDDSDMVTSNSPASSHVNGSHCFRVTPPKENIEFCTQIENGSSSKPRGDAVTRLSIKYTPNAPSESRSRMDMSNVTSNYHLKNNKENYYNLLNEKRSKYIKEAQNSLLNCGSRSISEWTGQKHFKDDRSCKSVDFDSEPNYQSPRHLSNGRLKMYDSETSSDYSRAVKYPRPVPPQKPLRLSLHKGCSLQSVKIIDNSDNGMYSKRSSRRSQKYDDTGSHHETKGEINVINDQKNKVWC